MGTSKSKTKAAARHKASDFCLDYSCALSVRKSKGTGKTSVRHKQSGKSADA